MLRRTLQIVAGAALVVLAGCGTTRSPGGVGNVGVPVLPAPAVVQTAYFADDRAEAPEELPPPKRLKVDEPVLKPPLRARVLTLTDFVNLTLDRNPRLAQVGWAVETARGRAVQVGLYPNPTVNIIGEEIGDREGPVLLSAPYITQEIVTGGKLKLAQGAAFKEVDQATLNVVTERYRLLTEVRQDFYELLTIQRRVEILEELVGLAEKTVENAEKLRKAGEAARLDVGQLQVDLERYRADLEATRRTLEPAFRRLTASAGVPDMPYTDVVGRIDVVPPDLHLEKLRGYVLSVHPELRSAQVGVERSQLLLQRAMAEPIPNVTVGAGYKYQGQNRSNDINLGVSFPVPVWNKNQGNIQAAKGQVGEAVNEVARIQNALVTRVSTAFSTFTAARKRVERYRASILPKAEETYQLALKGYKGGQLEYVRVLQTQRAVAEANLEYVRSLGEMWRAASEIAGLMLEDEWPLSLKAAPPR